jgi:hypothetical protein
VEIKVYILNIGGSLHTGGGEVPLKSKFRPFLTQITKNILFYDEIWIFSAKFYEIVLKKLVFWNFSKNGRIMDFSGTGLSDHRLKNRRTSSFLAFHRTKVQLGPKMAIFEVKP